MAKKTKPKKVSYPQRGRQSQIKQIEALEKRLRKGPLFDIKAAQTLKIDCHIGNKGCFPDLDISLLRREVHRLGKLAIRRASQLTKQLDEGRKAAREIKRVLDKVDRDTQWLRAQEVWDVDFGFKHERQGEFRSAALPLNQIIEDLKSLYEWTEVLKKHFQIKPPNEKRSEFFAHHFVELMIELYSRLTGKTAPKSRIGPFVRFLEAAWEDLYFPELPNDTLATMAGKGLPRLRENIIH